MSYGTVDVIAPKAVILPNVSEQLISGAIFISGAKLYFMDNDGSSARPRLVTST